VLGVTATPNLSGKKALGSFFEDIAYEIGLLDLIRDGYLSRISVQSFPLKASLGAAAAELGCDLISRGGDFDDRVSAHALEPYLDDIAERPLQRSSGGSRCSFSRQSGHLWFGARRRARPSRSC
jgi:hypothetical protein